MLNISNDLFDNKIGYLNKKVLETTLDVNYIALAIDAFLVPVAGAFSGVEKQCQAREFCGPARNFHSQKANAMSSRRVLRLCRKE